MGVTPDYFFLTKMVDTCVSVPSFMSLTVTFNLHKNHCQLVVETGMTGGDLGTTSL